MAKHIILMHGRDVKPARADFEKFGLMAIANGLRRAKFDDEADELENGTTRFSTAYYGDINNRILSDKHSSVKAKLKGKDPEFANAPCLESKLIDDAFKLTDAIRTFGPAAYKQVLADARDWRFLDEAADIASLFGALFSAGFINNELIKVATADLYAYLTEHTTGSNIRERLNTVLQPALLDDDEICLLTHSMGCVVAYDVLWKYAHMSEYADFRTQQKRVSLWLTFGDPLGELGVRQNLLDGRYSNPAERYPRKQVTDWLNVTAQDDFVAHVERVAPIYKVLKPNDLRNVSDAGIYNCWTYKDAKDGALISNPHDMYGYLMNQGLAKYLGKWLKL